MLIPLLLVGVAVVTLLLFGDLPVFRNTFVYRLHGLLMQTSRVLARQLHILDSRYLNGSIQKLESYAGWIIPLFYIIVFSSALVLFSQSTLPRIPNYHLLLIVPSVLFTYYTFSMAVLINPGTSPTPVFAYDNLLFFPADCRTCLVAKPARSKHCSLCGRCVQLFDHHCIWLNNDVGYYTYRYFIGFLVAKIWTFTYGAYLCWTALGVSPTMFWTTLRATSTENKITGTLFLLCVLLLPLVALFLGEHLRYIYLGVTTNETAKWDYIHYLMQNKLLYKDGSQFLVVDEMGYTTLTGAPINATRPAPVTSWDQLTNIYDHGFVSNLKQRLFPKPL